MAAWLLGMRKRHYGRKWSDRKWDEASRQWQSQCWRWQRLWQRSRVENCVRSIVGIWWTHQRDHKFRTFLTVSACEMCCWRAIYCCCCCCGFSCNSCCHSHSCLSAFHCICVLSRAHLVLVSNFHCHSHFIAIPFLPRFAIHHWWKTKSSKCSYEYRSD